MSYYPIFLELSGRPCLVVGAGVVAFRKAKALLLCQARVTVVSPAAARSLKNLAAQGKLRWRRRSFRVEDVKGMEVVVAATSDQAVNEKVSRFCRRRGILVNVVDQPKLCSYIVPSVVRRGGLTIAISTGGASPALSKWIRKDIAKRYGREFGKLVAQMSCVRGQILRKVAGVARRKKVFEKALAAYFKALKG